MTIAADDLGRADGGLGANYTTQWTWTNPGIVSNRLQNPSSGTNAIALRTAESYGKNQRAEVRVRTLAAGSNNYAGPVVRGDTASDASYVSWVNPVLSSTRSLATISIARRGSFKILAQGLYPMALDDYLALAIIDDFLWVEVNRSITGIYGRDSTLTTGAPGLIIGMNSAAADVEIDQLYFSDEIVTPYSGVNTRRRRKQCGAADWLDTRAWW